MVLAETVALLRHNSEPVPKEARAKDQNRLYNFRYHSRTVRTRST